MSINTRSGQVLNASRTASSAETATPDTSYPPSSRPFLMSIATIPSSSTIRMSLRGVFCSPIFNYRERGKQNSKDVPASRPRSLRSGREAWTIQGLACSDLNTQIFASGMGDNSGSLSPLKELSADREFSLERLRRLGKRKGIGAHHRGRAAFCAAKTKEESGFAGVGGCPFPTRVSHNRTLGRSLGSSVPC